MCSAGRCGCIVDQNFDGFSVCRRHFARSLFVTTSCCQGPRDRSVVKLWRDAPSFSVFFFLYIMFISSVNNTRSQFEATALSIAAKAPSTPSAHVVLGNCMIPAS